MKKKYFTLILLIPVLFFIIIVYFFDFREKESLKDYLQKDFAGYDLGFMSFPVSLGHPSERINITNEVLRKEIIEYIKTSRKYDWKPVEGKQDAIVLILSKDSEKLVCDLSKSDKVKAVEFRFSLFKNGKETNFYSTIYNSNNEFDFIREKLKVLAK